MPQGSSGVPYQSGDANASAASSSGSDKFAEHGAKSISHDAASDASSAKAIANGGDKEDVGHLRALSVYSAATEKLTQPDVSSDTQHCDISGLQGICTSLELDSAGNDR